MFSRDEQLMAAPMASDGGLRRLFEKPLPENPTLLEALSSFNRNIHPNKPIDPASFTEIFGELHFQEKQQKPDRDRGILLSQPPPPRPPPRTASWLDIAAEAENGEKSKDDLSLDALLRPKPASTAAAMKRSASFCMKKGSASFLLCTEGLGSESTVDADDMLKDGEAAALGAGHGKETTDTERSGGGDAKGDAAGAGEEGTVEKRPPPSFPRPIRSIGRGGGKPSVCFRSFREDGRFVLLEVVIPGNDLLQATREGGRLRLRFANGAAAATVAGGVGVDEEVHATETTTTTTPSQDKFVSAGKQVMA